MANPLDVGSRLAEGQPAVDDVRQYVAACHRLGYQHPDLTVHAAQVQDWYAREDGLDLRALDGDCAVLSAVASAAEEAARTQAGLVGEISGAWSGRGAAAAHEFTWRSAQAANTVSAAIRTAADAAATLRDALWRSVDAKVAAVTAIDGRHQAQRAEWIAAAKMVTSGSGDLAAASELIDQQVKPFVTNDVGTDWVAAMHHSDASIVEAFDAARATTVAAARATFEVPGELGPWVEVTGSRSVGDAPEPSPTVATVPAAVSSVPAAVSSVPAMAAMTASAPSPSAAPWPSAAAPGVTVPPTAAPPLADLATQAPMATMPAAAATPGLGGLGGGTSSLGGGLSGFGQQLADLIGGLVGSSDGGLPGATDVELDDGDEPNEPSLDEDVYEDGGDDDADADDAEEDDDADDDADEDADEDQNAPGDPEDSGTPADEVPPEAVPADQETDAEPTPCAGESVAVPTPVPTAIESQPDSPSAPQAIPEAAAETHEPTPCEIAADELPQVGE